MSLPFSEVVSKIRALAEACPDRKEGCTYFQGGAPVCIVGHVLADYGVVPARRGALALILAGAHGQLHFADGNVSASRLPWTLLGFAPTAEELEWLDDVQRYQDFGHSWGSAVVVADENAAGWAAGAGSEGGC